MSGKIRGENSGGKPEKPRTKVALVCAGGGVTGALYEIGCLRALEELLDRSAPADPDVEVEVEDAAVEEIVEGPQAPHLVDGARHPSARADQGHLRAGLLPSPATVLAADRPRQGHLQDGHSARTDRPG